MAKAWIAVLIALSAVARPRADVQRIAVLIGVDRGLREEAPLSYASRDAREMADALQSAGTFDEDRIYLMQNPSVEKVRLALEQVKGRLEELRKSGTETLVLLYYSGHADAHGLHILGHVLPRADLEGTFSSLDANLKVLILDACEAGDFLRPKGARLVESPETVRLDRLTGKGIILISSSGRGEMSQESEAYRGAVFTHHFVNGLRGLADFDDDHCVRLMEAFDYARVLTKRERIFGNTDNQNPEFDLDLTGESDPVLARLEPGRQCHLLFAGMPAGPMEIYDGHTMEIAAKVWLTGQDSVNLVLPSRKYILVAPGKGYASFNQVDLSWQTRALVRPGDFRKMAESLHRGKGGSRLDFHLHGIQYSALRLPVFGGLTLNRLGYVFRGYYFKQSIEISMTAGEFGGNGTGLTNSMRIFGAGYSLQTPILRGSRLQVLTGAEGAIHQVFQRIDDTRFGGSPIESEEGRVAVAREQTARLYHLALPLDLEIFLPFRFWMSLRGAAAGYAYRDRASGNYRPHFGFEPGVALGHQF
jgi:hypothetical protein